MLKERMLSPGNLHIVKALWTTPFLTVAKMNLKYLKTFNIPFSSSEYWKIFHALLSTFSRISFRSPGSPATLARCLHFMLVRSFHLIQSLGWIFTYYIHYIAYITLLSQLIILLSKFHSRLK